MSEVIHQSKTQRILLAFIVIQAGIFALMFSGNWSSNFNDCIGGKAPLD
ncbi:MAG: hypothetical protein ACKO15_16500 [Burkholderiales bacterium]